MPTRTNKRTGEVQDFRNGQWVTIQPASQGGPMFSVQTRGPDQTLPARIQKGNNEAQASNYAPGTAAAEQKIKEAEAANALAIATAQRDKAQADAKTAAMEANGGRKLDPSVRAQALAGFRFSEQLNSVADDLLKQFNAGPGSTHGIHGLEDYLPYTANQQFDNTANKSRGIVGQTLGFTGGQLNTPREAEQAVGPFIPQADDRDPVAMDKINSVRDLAKQGRAKAIQVLGGVPDENGNVIPVTQGQVQPQQQADPLQLNGGGKTRAQIDPMLRATGQRLGQMMVDGSPDGKILKFLQDSGVDPSTTNVNQALQLRHKPEFRNWMQANPGHPYPIGPQFYTKQVPVSAGRRLFNKAAATDLGGDVAAGIVATGDSMLGGRGSKFVGSISGDPEMAQTGMQLLRTNHPGASFVGDLAGQGLLEAGVSRIPGANALMGTAMGRRVADAGYGAYSGSGQSDDPTAGGITGALSGLGFGMAGRGAQKTLGGALTGVRDQALQYMHGKNIPMTLGQIARGVGNIGDTGTSNIADEVGTGVGGVEERLMGIPGLEAWIKTARKRGDVAFNKEAFKEVAPGVLGTGIEGLTNAKAAETAAYDKLKDVRLSVHPDFESKVGAIGDSASGLLHHGNDVADVVNDVRAQITDGGMTGKGYQTALQAIRKTRAGLNDDVGGKAAAALSDLEDHVLDLGASQGGTVGKDLAEANAIHARRQIIKQASKSPVAQGAAEMFSPKGLNQASIGNTEKYGGLDRALSSDRPFYDLTSNAMKVMPNLTPDSGTAGRMMLYGGLGTLGGSLGGALGGLTGDHSAERAGEGGGMGVGGGLTLAALLSAPYSRGGQNIIQKALLGKRSQRVTRLGDMLINNTRLAGLLSQAGGRDYFQQPELPE